MSNEPKIDEVEETELDEPKKNRTDPFGLGDEILNRDHKAAAESRLERQKARQRAHRAHRAVTVPTEAEPLRTTGDPSKADSVEDREGYGTQDDVESIRGLLGKNG
jgi:sRNA-binding protein